MTDLVEETLVGTADPSDRQRIRALGLRLIPPDPSPLVPTIAVPPPKPLDPTWSDTHAATFLARVYREAVRQRMHIDAGAYRSGDPLRWAGYTTLVRAAHELRRLELAPEAWAQFSMDVWVDHMQMEGLPRPLWIWSPKRLNTHLAWYGERADVHAGRRHVLCAKHLRLVEDWRAMWADLIGQRPQDRGAVDAVVARHFPGTTYETRLTSAKVEAVKVQRMVDDEGPMAVRFM